MSRGFSRQECWFPGKNAGVSHHFLIQGIFPTQGLNLCLLHWQADSVPLSHQGSPKGAAWVWQLKDSCKSLIHMNLWHKMRGTCDFNTASLLPFMPAGTSTCQAPKWVHALQKNVAERVWEPPRSIVSQQAPWRPLPWPLSSQLPPTGPLALMSCCPHHHPTPPCCWSRSTLLSLANTRVLLPTAPGQTL